MAPRTRRLRAKVHTTGDDEPSSSITTQIQALLSTAREMEKDMKALRAKNQELQDNIDAQEEIDCSKRTRGSPTKRVAELEREVKVLKESQKKDKRKIQALKAKELKAEAENLRVDDGGAHDQGDEIDMTYKMRKLLRKLSDLVLAPTLDEQGEDCAICMEKLEVKKTSSFPCEHSVCNDCLPGISKGADETVQCPHCRRNHPRDEVELVHMTERERWDALLEVAKAWCAIDTIAEAETSEEEAQEDFIDDGETVSSALAGEEQDDDNEMDMGPSTPSPNNHDITPVSYANSPPKEKRARMMELAKSRKKSRYT